MTLTFLLIHPTHYFEFLLSNLQDKLGKEIQIETYFLEQVNPQYPWVSNFMNGYKSESLRGSFFSFRLYKSIISNKKSITILVGWDRLDKIFLILFLAILRKKYFIYTDTPNIYRERSKIKKLLRDSILKFIGKTSNGLITTGQIGVETIKTWGIQFKNIYNLPFFVNNEQFKPHVENNHTNEFTLFSSGRLVNSHKGYDIALSALGNLKKERKIEGFKYFIAGEGEDREYISKLIQTNNLSNEVVLLGWVEPSQLISYYQSCDIFLHPSYFDPYPNAVLEAMACGATIIASDRAGSAKDRIIDDFNGFLFNSGNIRQLENSISNIYNNKDTISRIGKQARLTALEWPVSKGVEVIKKIINEN
jgi:glycosyltransferase involved in cell wall biosynthesis